MAAFAAGILSTSFREMGFATHALNGKTGLIGPVVFALEGKHELTLLKLNSVGDMGSLQFNRRSRSINSKAYVDKVIQVPDFVISGP